MAEAPSELASLYIPVADKNLLLPNVTVAEVVDYQTPTEKSGTPDYFLGSVKWRGVDIPLVSYEIANGEQGNEQSSNARIAVINTIGDHQKQLPFFAIVTQGIPRLVKVNSDAIESADSKTGPADSMNVKLDGEDATIPNIEHLEQLVLQNL